MIFLFYSDAYYTHTYTPYVFFKLIQTPFFSLLDCYLSTLCYMIVFPRGYSNFS